MFFVGERSAIPFVKGTAMRDVSRLSASRLEALYVERRAEMTAVSKELIAAGLGMVSGEEIRKLAANEDPLALRYVEALDAFLELACERSARLRGPGAAKTFGCAMVNLGSAIGWSPEREERVPVAGRVLAP